MKALLQRLLNEGNERVHAVLALMAGSTLCACALVLACGAYCGKSVTAEFAASIAAVAGLAGWTYGKGKECSQSLKPGPNAPNVEAAPSAVAEDLRGLEGSL